MSMLKALRRQVMAGWAGIRSTLPTRVQDAFTNLPTSATGDTQDLCHVCGWRCDPLPPATRPPVPIPRLADRDVAEAFRQNMPSTPTTRFVAHLPRGRVLGTACSAIASGGVVLADVSPHLRTPPRHHRALTSFLWAPPPRRLSGVAAVVGTVGRHNHYHWLLECLPRIEGLFDLPDVDEVDHWIVPRSRLRWTSDAFTRLGIPDDRIVALGPMGHVEADLLLAPASGCKIGEPSSEAVEFLRRGFGTPRHAQGRRLFVTRRHSRTISNGAEVEATLAALGFETIDPATFGILDQARIFGEASVVVGVHGAGLANIALMPPGGTILEIVPPVFMSACYAVLAAAAGHVHGAIRAEGSPRPGSRHAPLRVDACRLVEGLERLGLAGSAR